MEIRTATSSDIAGLVELWVELLDFHSDLDPSFTRSEGAASRWADHITSKLDDGTHLILVATDGHVLTGYIVAIAQNYPPIWTVEKFGFIQEIAVASSYRRQGIARQLVRVAEAWLRAVGMPYIEVRIDVANEASHQLFSGEGFVRQTETLIKKYGADA